MPDGAATADWAPPSNRFVDISAAMSAKMPQSFFMIFFPCSYSPIKTVEFTV